MAGKKNKFVYSESIVCFLDILGFKEIVENSISENSVYREDAIGFELMLIEKLCHNDNQYPENNDIKYIQFSDSIIIFSPVSMDNLVSILYKASSIISGCLLFNHLCRGALSAGKLCHDNSIIFGPALVKAAELEKLACSPRVIIDEEAFSRFSINISEFNSKNPQIHDSIISIDSDDYIYFIDYITNGIHEDCAHINVLGNINNLYKITMKGLSHHEERVRKKYIWLAKKYNEYARKFKALPGTSMWGGRKFSEVELIDEEYFKFENPAKEL